MAVPRRRQLLNSLGSKLSVALPQSSTKPSFGFLRSIEHQLRLPELLPYRWLLVIFLKKKNQERSQRCCGLFFCKLPQLPVDEFNLKGAFSRLNTKSIGAAQPQALAICLLKHCKYIEFLNIINTQVEQLIGD
jgi:hypothetical protein